MTAIVVKKWETVLLSLAVLVILSLVLYKYWYKNLEKYRSPGKIAADSLAKVL